MPSDMASILNLGCGITAYNEDDVIGIFSKIVVPTYGKREISYITVDVDVSKLDQNHIIPNMSSPAARGVWFPVM